jgi:N-acetylmuramoyl-L-alanine amidase
MEKVRAHFCKTRLPSLFAILIVLQLHDPNPAVPAEASGAASDVSHLPSKRFQPAQSLLAQSPPDELVGEEPTALRELTGLHVYIDPGHGGINPPGLPCQEFGATGPAPDFTYEKDWTLRIALELGPILNDNGAQTFYTRTSDVTKCNLQRAQENNSAYQQFGGTPTNWRYLSIHLNGSGYVINTDKTEMYHSSSNYQSQGRELADSGKEWLGRLVNASEQNRVSEAVDYTVLFNSLPLGYNLLTESNYLANNAAFQNRLLHESGFVHNLAYTHYRTLAEFWLVGRDSPAGALHSGILAEYKDLLSASVDPGLPFDNGGGYYAHPWYEAITQEFIGGTGPYGAPRGSILGFPGASEAAYVPDPIWSVFITKGGPRRGGTGVPTQSVHQWTTGRGIRGNQFTYPMTVNFQNGAITHNDYEGIVYLPNCNAADLQTYYPAHWATGYALDLVKRFAISNEPYFNGAVNMDDYPWRSAEQAATRAQLAQTLMFAEGFEYYTGSGFQFADIQGHWGRPWIRMAASRAIVEGYDCGVDPNEPCNSNNDPYFRPDNQTTRGQFSKMLVLTRGWSGTPSGQQFDDVPPGGTFYEYIQKLVNQNYDPPIIVGYPCGGPGEPCVPPSNRPYFRPDGQIFRGQMVKMVARAYSPFALGGCW